MRNLDPRAPFVLDTHELGRRPGSQRKLSFSAGAPAELGIEILGVPEGSSIDIDLRLEAVMEGVLVTGTAQAGLVGECDERSVQTWAPSSRLFGLLHALSPDPEP